MRLLGVPPAIATAGQGEAACFVARGEDRGARQDRSNVVLGDSEAGRQRGRCQLLRFEKLVEVEWGHDRLYSNARTRHGVP